MKTRKLSVIMSVFNEDHYFIEKAVYSILNQTFKDFEFIIVNDNPANTKTLALLNQYAINDERIVIIENDANIGLTKSLNKALSISHGDLIARMDADDFSYPERFSTLIKCFEQYPDVSVCCSNYDLMNEKSEVIGKSIINKKRCSIESLFLKNIIAHSTVMFRRELLDLRTPFYNETYRTSQDYELWSFLLLNNISFHYIDKPLLLYRHSSHQTGQRDKTGQKSNFKIIRRNLYVEYLKRIGIEISINDASTHILKVTKAITTKGEDHLIKANILYLLYYSASLMDKRYVIKYIFDKRLILFKQPFAYSIYIILLLLGRNSWPILEY